MTSATHATPAVCSNLLPERQATPQPVCASRGVEAFYSASAFVNTWVSAPPRTVITRPEYVAQYNGVGECPF